MTEPDNEVDVTGMTCPMPLITLSQTVTVVGAGKTLLIRGDDPIFEQGVRDFCTINHHEVVSVSPQSGRVIEILIRTSSD